MKNRPYWVERIERAWAKRPIVWLSGVRRAGKTTLTKMLGDVIYMNCDLPSVGRRLADPELFYNGLGDGTRVVFDEVHRLEDPSRLLKIGSDTYPHLRILATGSSTLAATNKFRDMLTGRKESILLTPVFWSECRESFDIQNLDRRLLHGGLPELLLAAEKDDAYCAEWIDSFYARDVQELFAIRNRTGFLKLLELLLRQSGRQVDYTNLGKLTDMTRQTVKAHIEALTVGHVVTLLPPYHGGGRREITRRPKAFAFDTGFVAFARGWDSIHDEDRGLLWEHLVLDELRTNMAQRDIFYWRDKSRREIDFVIRRSEGVVDAVECKMNPDRLNVDALAVFRDLYPNGRNYVVTPAAQEPYEMKRSGLKVTVCSVVKGDDSA